jgi:putative FmdB family regulatory protein
MPIYEYQCRKCGHSFDHLARTLQAPPPKCPKCGARNPVKQLSTFSASVSGGGNASACPTGTCPTGTCPL